MSYTLNVHSWGKFRKSALAAAGATCLLLGTAVSANAWVIDFENLGSAGTIYGNPAGWVIDREYSSNANGSDATGSPGQIPNSGGIQATFSTYRYNSGNYQSAYGTLYNTAPPATGGDTDLLAPFCQGAKCDQGGTNQINPGHILIIHEYPSECQIVAGKCKDPDDEGSQPAGKFVIEFSELVWLDSIDFFDIEGAENGHTNKNEIKLYSGATEILPDTYWTPDTGGDNTWAEVDFEGVGVTKIVIEMKGSGGIDNITGHLAQAVPEPASAGLFAVGMVAFGAARRRRRERAGA